MDVAYIVCRVPRKQLLAENIVALPWHALDEVYRLLDG